MFHPLRALRERTDADDARMRADGFDVIKTGRLSRTYRLNAGEIARRRQEADNEHVQQMAQRSRQLYALAFPEEHAAALARQAATLGHPAAAPGPVAQPVPLDQLAAALAAHGARIVFERLTVDPYPRPGTDR